MKTLGTMNPSSLYLNSPHQKVPPPSSLAVTSITENLFPKNFTAVTVKFNSNHFFLSVRIMAIVNPTLVSFAFHQFFSIPNKKRSIA